MPDLFMLRPLPRPELYPGGGDVPGTPPDKLFEDGAAFAFEDGALYEFENA